MDSAKLQVICMVSNPIRYQSRYRLYQAFKEHMQRSGVVLWTVEVAFGERGFELTQAGDIHDLQLRTSSELWIKERALNLLVQRLTTIVPDWKYLAWLDADIEFPRWTGPGAWPVETVQQLQHYRIVQMFQHAIDLGPNGEHLHTHNGFGWCYRTCKPWKDGYVNWHPGFCWAIRREAYDACPFIDWGVLGSGDRHMACGWINQIEQSLNRKCSGPYWRKLDAWQRQAERYVRRDIGFVPGVVMHHWHGRKKDRQYQDRWKILVDTQFDPDRDIKHDAYGLWQLADHGDSRSIVIRDRIRQYFRSRSEDSIDLE